MDRYRNSATIRNDSCYVSIDMHAQQTRCTTQHLVGDGSAGRAQAGREPRLCGAAVRRAPAWSRAPPPCSARPPGPAACSRTACGTTAPGTASPAAPPTPGTPAGDAIVQVSAVRFWCTNTEHIRHPFCATSTTHACGPRWHAGLVSLCKGFTYSTTPSHSGKAAKKEHDTEDIAAIAALSTHAGLARLQRLKHMLDRSNHIAMAVMVMESRPCAGGHESA